MDFKTLILFLFLLTFISRAEFIIHPSNEGKITSGVRDILYTHLCLYCSVIVLTILSVDLSSSIQGCLICVALTEEMKSKGSEIVTCFTSDAHPISRREFDHIG